MKMHITLEDLAQLTENQKLRLSELWKPEKYDLAAASVCKDAENEEYDVFEFVVGNAFLDTYKRVFLMDIKAPDIDINESDADESEISENVENSTEDVSTFGSALKSMESPFMDEEETAENDEDFEPEFETDYTRPTCFNKGECCPLLNIGQMIELLQRKNFGEGDFYMTASTADVGCELGKNAASWDRYGSDYEGKELCDVLWALTKTILA